MDIDEFKQRKVKRGYVWLKLFTDLIDEPEFMQLTDKAKAVYFEVYILAGRSDAGGLITSSDKPAKLDQLAWFLRRTIDELQGALDELQNTGFVDLQGGQVTVCRFGNEQGPSQDEKRAQWREWQRESRANAKGEKLPDKPNADEHEKQNEKQTEKEKKQTEQDLKTQTKRVSSMSDQSQVSVSPDTVSGGGGDFVSFGKAILQSWKEITGKTFEANEPFNVMVKKWLEAGVTLDDVRQAFLETKHKAHTPFMVQSLAVNIRNARPEVQAGKELDAWRALYNQYNQAEGRDE